MHDRRNTFWRLSFNGFGPLSLSTMAGMGIGSALFVVSSVVALGRDRAAEAGPRYRAAFGNAFGLASLSLFLVALASLAAAHFAPPLGTAGGPVGDLKKFLYFVNPPLFALAFLYSGKGSAREIERHPFWRFWGGAGVLLFFVALAQFFAKDLFPEAWLGHRFFRAAGSSGRYHGQGLMFFHLSFASCLSFVAAAGLARVIWPLARESRGDRIFWLLVGLAGAGAVYFSYSRAGLGALAILLCTLGFLRRPLWGLGTVFACAGLAAVLWFSVPSLRQRFIEASSYNSERYILWETAWSMFQDRPLLGVGFGRTGQYSPLYSERLLGHPANFTSHAHNNVLDMLGAMGAAGLVAFLFWWGTLFAWAFRAFREAPVTERWLPGAAIAGFVAFHVNGLTQVNFWDGKSQHTLMLWAGVVVALELRRRARGSRGGRT